MQICLSFLHWLFILRIKQNKFCSSVQLFNFFSPFIVRQSDELVNMVEHWADKSLIFQNQMKRRVNIKLRCVSWTEMWLKMNACFGLCFWLASLPPCGQTELIAGFMASSHLDSEIAQFKLVWEDRIGHPSWVESHGFNLKLRISASFHLSSTDSVFNLFDFYMLFIYIFTDWILIHWFHTHVLFFLHQIALLTLWLLPNRKRHPKLSSNVHSIWSRHVQRKSTIHTLVFTAWLTLNALISSVGR